MASVHGSVNAKPRNQGKRWTNLDNVCLDVFLNKGNSHEQIGRKLGRTTSSIKLQIRAALILSPK